MPDTLKLEKLNRELEKSEKKLRKAINDEKALQHQLKQLTRKERTHRLCTRGGMLESFLQEPERLTDDDVMLLLKLIFHRQGVGAVEQLLCQLLDQLGLAHAGGAHKDEACGTAAAGKIGEIGRASCRERV